MTEELWSAVVPVVFDNMGWLIALVPLFACFISNWVTMGASTFFRIHPSICIAPLATFITQTLGVLVVVVLLFIPFALWTHSLVLLNLILAFASGLGVAYVLRLTDGECSARFEGSLAWIFVFGCFLSVMFTLASGFPVSEGRLFPFPTIDNSSFNIYLGLLVDRLNIADVITLSVLDIIATLTLLCVLACVIGMYYSAHREPRLVDRDKRLMVLAVFSGGTCVVAHIAAIRREKGKRLSCWRCAKTKDLFIDNANRC